MLPRVILNTALRYANALLIPVCSTCLLHFKRNVLPRTCDPRYKALNGDHLNSPCCAEILPLPDLEDDPEKHSLKLKELADKVQASGKTAINYITGDMPLYSAAGDTLLHGQ